MFNKHLKSFTIAELAITVFVLALTMVVAVNILFKVEKVPKRVVSDRINSLICYEGSEQSASCPECVRYTEDAKYGDGCDFDFTSEIASKEFFEIDLIGGGGATGYKQSGAGRLKTVVYPSLLMPFERVNKRNCDSPFCEECPTKANICTKCVKGYKVESDSCRENFKYRAVIGKAGKTAAECAHSADANCSPNGEDTYLEVIDLNENVPDEEIITIIEKATGGTVSGQTCEEDDCDEVEKSGSPRGKGNTGMSGEVKISW